MTFATAAAGFVNSMTTSALPRRARVSPWPFGLSLAPTMATTSTPRSAARAATARPILPSPTTAMRSSLMGRRKERVVQPAHRVGDLIAVDEEREIHATRAQRSHVNLDVA